MTDWFRSWHGAPTDNKWLVIGRKAGVAPGIVSAVFWALLDHASQAAERGRVDDFDAETYAVFSGFEQEKVEAVYRALEDKELIVSGHLVSWEKRQPKKEDPDAAERKRLQRERDIETKRPEQDVSHNVTQRHESSHSVTIEERRVEEIRKEEEVSASPEAKPPLPPVEMDSTEIAFRRFNAFAKRHRAWQPAKKLDAKRRTSLKRRLEEMGGLEAWECMLERIDKSDFLSGKTPRDDKHKHWRLEFDWLLKPETQTKIDEGKYDNRGAPSNGHAPGNGHVSEREWRDRLNVWNEGHQWSSQWGPRPGEPECKVPPELLTRETGSPNQIAGHTQ